MLMLTRMPTRSKCMWGSSVGACEVRATTSVSFGCAPAGWSGSTAATRASATRTDRSTERAVISHLLLRAGRVKGRGIRGDWGFYITVGGG